MANYGYLAHHGIEGQKWGVRRYQNPDGSLTDAGRARYYRTNNKRLKKEWEALNGRRLRSNNVEDQKSFRQYAIDNYEGDYVSDRIINDKIVEKNTRIAIDAAALATVLAAAGGIVLIAKDDYVSEQMDTLNREKRKTDNWVTRSDSDSDFTLKSGQKIYRKTGDKDNINNGKKEMYVSVSKSDKALYGSQMGTAVVNKETGGYTRVGPEKGYDVTMTTNKDIKVAGRDAFSKAVKNAAIKEMYYTKANDYNKLYDYSKKYNKNIIEIKKEAYDGAKSSVNSNKVWSSDKAMANDFNAAMVKKGTVINGKKALPELMEKTLERATEELKNSGYNAILDLNDSGVLAKQPVILLDPDNDVSVSSIKKRNALTYVKDVWDMPIDLTKYMEK